MDESCMWTPIPSSTHNKKSEGTGLGKRIILQIKSVQSFKSHHMLLD